LNHRLQITLLRYLLRPAEPLLGGSVALLVFPVFVPFFAAFTPFRFECITGSNQPYTSGCWVLLTFAIGFIQVRWSIEQALYRSATVQQHFALQVLKATQDGTIFCFKRSDNSRHSPHEKPVSISK
jgi:hypothetical protein